MIILFNTDALHNERGRCASCYHAPKKGGKVPSLRVNNDVMQVLASPQGLKAAAPPARSDSRRRARGETKPQHALEPARSLESCVCLRKLQHSKRMGTLSSALGSRGCEQPAPCVPRLPGLALPPGRSGPPTEGSPSSNATAAARCRAEPPRAETCAGRSRRMPATALEAARATSQLAGCVAAS